MRSTDDQNMEIKERCEAALNRLKELQPKLNAVVTFCDIDERDSKH